MANVPVLPGVGSNPLTPGVGTLPTIVPGAAPSPITPGAPGVSISSGLNTTDGAYTLTGDFKDTYGAGTGTALASTLGSLGTATNGAVAATNSAIQADAAKTQANIGSSLAAGGISNDSSTYALATGDFQAGVNQNIASTDANMELSEENTLISALQNEGNAHGSDVSTWDSIASAFSGGLLGTIGQAAGGISEATGASGGAASILDTLAMFG